MHDKSSCERVSRPGGLMLIEKKKIKQGRLRASRAKVGLAKYMLRSAVIMWASASVGSDTVRKVVVLWNRKRVLQHSMRSLMGAVTQRESTLALKVLHTAL